jgi:hypothetical protein
MATMRSNVISMREELEWKARGTGIDSLTANTLSDHTRRPSSGFTDRCAKELERASYPFRKRRKKTPIGINDN